MDLPQIAPHHDINSIVSQRPVHPLGCVLIVISAGVIEIECLGILPAQGMDIHVLELLRQAKDRGKYPSRYPGVVHPLFTVFFMLIPSVEFP